MTPYKFVGTTPRDLSSGRPLAFGDVVDLPKKVKPHDFALIAEGVLIPAEPDPEPAETDSNDPAPDSAPEPEENS